MITAFSMYTRKGFWTYVHVHIVTEITNARSYTREGKVVPVLNELSTTSQYTAKINIFRAIPWYDNTSNKTTEWKLCDALSILMKAK
jgi:hypothetical protein